MDEKECDICNNRVGEIATIDARDHFLDVDGLDTICFTCVINVIEANVSSKTLQRFVDR